ncbi:hypothetical protein [Halorubrum sp. AJ67]|uniref:hypothetical protein n=1 Tax=Halorubrum sp. AJ67 TaxID=1173487 RepID=UPI0003DD766E|nr:hypothetical protein [Halorubrum sp. AJ67]CDK40722.1 nucleotide sugar dehydrogenase [Halorubrum sp. AJ67]
MGETLAEKDGHHDVVVKSTFVPGTTEDTLAPLLAETSSERLGEDLGVEINPEFLREGTAVADFLNLDKVVLGADNERTRETMPEIFESLVKHADNSPMSRLGRTRLR